MTEKPEFKLEGGVLLIDGKSFRDISYEIAHSQNVVDAFVEKLNSIGPAVHGLGQAELEALVDEIEGIADAGFRDYALQLFMSFSGKKPDKEGKVFKPFDRGDPVDWMFTPTRYPGTGKPRPITWENVKNEDDLRERVKLPSIKKVEDNLVRLPSEYFRPQIKDPVKKTTVPREGEMWVSKEMYYRLDLLINAVIGTGRSLNNAKIEVISGYRVPGTSAGEDENEDVHGSLDATDEHGHWSGDSIDLATRTWRGRVSPKLKLVNEEMLIEEGVVVPEEGTTSMINELDVIAYRNLPEGQKLYRPLKAHPNIGGDYCHWAFGENAFCRVLQEYGKDNKGRTGVWGVYTKGNLYNAWKAKKRG